MLEGEKMSYDEENPWPEERIECPNCGEDMIFPSSSAVNCPSCGYYKQYEYE